MTETNGHDVASQPALSPENAEVIKLSRKDFVSDQEVRWCPGCGARRRDHGAGGLLTWPRATATSSS